MQRIKRLFHTIFKVYSVLCVVILGLKSEQLVKQIYYTKS